MTTKLSKFSQLRFHLNGSFPADHHVFSDSLFLLKDLHIRKNVAAETFRVNVDYNVAWVSKREGSKIFCFREANSTSSNMLLWQTDRGNNRETFKVSTSSVFPKCFLVCDATQHMLKTQNLRLEGKTCFWNFPKPFLASWTQFCFRSNVSLFAPALRSRSLVSDFCPPLLKQPIKFILIIRPSTCLSNCVQASLQCVGIMIKIELRLLNHVGIFSKTVSDAFRSVLIYGNVQESRKNIS